MNEVITYAHTRDITLPGNAGTLALITLDNGKDHTKPTTLGVQGMRNIHDAVNTARTRASNGEIVAVAITGKPYVFAAGADLKGVSLVATHDEARALGTNGHNTLRILGEMTVPTFAFINGAALGGGLEVALNCTHRTLSTDVNALALPETGLGLIPGWGGTYLLPRLVGIEHAISIIIDHPARNRRLRAKEAHTLGLVDVLLEPADFLEQSLAWAAQVITGDITVSRRPLDNDEQWAAALSRGFAQLDATVNHARPAPYRALELLALGPHISRDEGFTAEDDALADLIMTDEFRASIYAFHAVNAAKRPKGAPDSAHAVPLTGVGIVGAGLMAAQIAVTIAQRVDAPIIMRDLDEEKVAHGMEHVHSTLDKLVQQGRLSEQRARTIGQRVTGTTDITQFTSCSLIIEAVTEIMSVKKQVFAELEHIVSPQTIFATNTSALSITQMSAHLKHPERVVGIHFFNPVAKMPLVEVISTPTTSKEALATAFALVKDLRKTAILAHDRPGFIVNRLLVLLMGTVIKAVEQGTDLHVADQALTPLGLPMPPFALFDLVGPAVGLHVLTSLREELGDRFARSPGLERIVADGTRVVDNDPSRLGPPHVSDRLTTYFGGGDHPRHEQEVLDLVLTALTKEIGMMLDEGVAQDATDIDVAMILGAGWPFALGGITPYLDRTGYTERYLGRRLHEPGVASVPSS